jgi:hyperosmotically inducible protein
MKSPNPNRNLIGMAFTVLACVTMVLAFSTSAAAAVSDQDRASIAKEVRHELVMLPYYSVFDNLYFQVGKDGSVTLMGQVTRPTLKDDAGRVAKKVSGVTAVQNQIEVLPLSPDDDRIRREAFRVIYGEAALNRYALQAVPPIHIIVKNGHISLEGVVASQADKNLAGIRANGVNGAFSVENNLRVEE